MFPLHSQPESEYNQRGEPMTDLSLIYIMTYDSPTPENEVTEYLNSLDCIEYCQPHYINRLLYTPDDQYNSNQYYLKTIKAFDAWGIVDQDSNFIYQGDTNVVIGITDTGVDIDHEDLIGNIKYNYNDPPNGIDDDNDGYIDNFRGWDLGDNDNNTQADKHNHGIWVSGIAGASTDNHTGISGVGFKCKFLPVKISNSNNILNMAYEGIVYAADHGCHIINCSWGAAMIGHPYGQDIINYATFNKDALVVAAAGNDGNDVPFYPASYDHVVSVAGTNDKDIKAEGSSYGLYIDLSAPSMNTYTTNNNNGYISLGFGTSFAAPIVSGCAAIVKSAFPSLSALQVGEKLKVSTDIIDTVAGNEPYAQLLGSGRVNLYKALTENNKPSVIFHSYTLTDQNDDIFEPNDTIYIRGFYTNYLNPSSANLKVTLSVESSDLYLITKTNTPGILNTMETKNNFLSPFRICLSPLVSYDEKIILKLTISDISSSYSSIQYIEVRVYPSTAVTDTNNINATITAKGKLGYNDTALWDGIGFTYKNSYSLLAQAGLMIAKSSAKVSDCLGINNDFKILTPARETLPPAVSHTDIHSSWDDSYAGDNKINISVNQNCFAWNTPKDKNYIILEYYIINGNSFALTDLYAGLYIDWDIYLNYNTNKIAFDKNRKLSYTYSTEQDGLFTGITMLSSQSAIHYAIDRISGANGDIIDITDGFSEIEKYFALTNFRHSAGAGASGNDVAAVLSAGPLSIEPLDTVRIAFALSAGENLFTIQNNSDAAQKKYDSLYTSIRQPDKPDKITMNLFPNPTKGSLGIQLYLPYKQTVEISITSLTGNTIRTFSNTLMPAGNHNIQANLSEFPEGIYMIRLKTENYCGIKKIIVIH